MLTDTTSSPFSVENLQTALFVEPGAFPVADLGSGCFINTLVRGAVSCDEQDEEEEEEVAESNQKHANDDDDPDFDPTNEEEEEEDVAKYVDKPLPDRRKARACLKRVRKILKWEECSEDSPEYQASDRRMRRLLLREKRRRRR
tara:strand:- start:14 stop:445 length:432 start_codon:yes stop_codon:yes gene_type:complete